MAQNTGNALPRQDDATVSIPRGAHGAPFAPAAPADGVTVLVPGAVLAPAPTADAAEAGEAPVFVDDSGGRKRMLRIVGVLLGLLSISFLAVVGVALAVPSVATSVGLGDVVPFVVPGAAAPPPPKPPVAPAPRVQVVKPKPKPAPAPTTQPKPVEAAPTTQPAPATSAPATSAPVTSAPPTQAPVTQPPGNNTQNNQTGGGNTQPPGNNTQNNQTGGGNAQPGPQAPIENNPPAPVADAVAQ